jgi:hypothetical protein
MNPITPMFCYSPGQLSTFDKEGKNMQKEANSVWDVVGAALLAMAIPIFIFIGLGMAALFGKF